MSTDPLHTVCYISKLVDDWTPSAIERLSARFSDANARRGITGCMGIRRLDVLQVLEGPRSSVEELYHRIQTDPRHVDIVLMASIGMSSRRFEDWGMIALPYGAVAEVADQIRHIHGR